MRLLVVSPLTYRHCFKLQLANPLETSHLTSMLKHLEPDALDYILGRLSGIDAQHLRIAVYPRLSGTPFTDAELELWRYVLAPPSGLTFSSLRIDDWTTLQRKNCPRDPTPSDHEVRLWTARSMNSKLQHLVRLTLSHRTDGMSLKQHRTGDTSVGLPICLVNEGIFMKEFNSFPKSDRFMLRIVHWPRLCHLAPTPEDLEYADRMDGCDGYGYRFASPVIKWSKEKQQRAVQKRREEIKRRQEIDPKYQRTEKARAKRARAPWNGQAPVVKKGAGNRVPCTACSANGALSTCRVCSSKR